jgi:GntR family transcriptional repressor for pyruvate dehydrogenase complex
VAEPQPSPDGLFHAVATHRMSTDIVAQIRGLIRDKRLLPGDRLPSERELGAFLSAGRVTVREALRVLQADGLIVARVGAGGGSYVTRPSPDRLGAGLARLIEGATRSAQDVTEARLAVELQLIPVVVTQATEDDIGDLRRLADAQIARLSQGRYIASSSAQFHIRVGACAHNPAIDMLMNTFYGPLVMSLRAAKNAAPLMGEHGAREHREFADAVAARDVERATRVMRLHITRTVARLAAADGTQLPGGRG